MILQNAIKRMVYSTNSTEATGYSYEKKKIDPNLTL